MRIATISDIHIDINHKYPIIDELIACCQRQYIDVLIIAGDISNHYEMTMQALDVLDAEIDADIYFVPGNHDLWKSEQHGDSQAIYQAYAADPRCLANTSIALDDKWQLIGDVGWFDYSFGNAAFSRADFDDMAHDGRTWQDQHFNAWCADNLAISQRFVDQFERQLTAAAGKSIIFVTHMIGHRYFAVPESRTEWRYFNAFLGSARLGELAVSHHVRHHIIGHVHYRRELNENGVHSICACLNYHKQWQTDDVAVEVDDALYVFEV